MGSSTVKYQYALNEEDHIVNINELSEKDRRDYECLGCGNVLRPVLPKIKQKHFRHKVKCDCSLETYLHRMGKKLFFEKYNECKKQGIPYIIEYEIPVVCNFCKHGPCKKENDRATYDLTKLFTSISEEERDDNDLIPDVLLQTETGEKIYIEIAVTHKSSSKKINSGIRVIEFILTDEEDLNIFKKAKISFIYDSIKTFNFNPDLIKKNLKNQCQKEISYFTVTTNGKCKINTVAIYEFDQIQNSSKNYIVKVPYPSSYFFIEEAEKAFLKGVKVKNCFLCRYHAINKSFNFSEETRPIFCKFYKSAKNSNMAAQCEIYRPDKKVFRSIKS
ncbi:MAG: hypothetical protein D3915_15410 [Candidatus Electrothrix sp. AU1_5]|nr:hypothetical protein [Candidatus Electrothrix gigas]